MLKSTSHGSLSAPVCGFYCWGLVVVPTEPTPVLDEKNNKAARIRSFAILRWLLCANSSYSMTEIYISLCTRLFISSRISLKCKLWEAMELNDKEVSSFSRSNSCKQLDSDILITFSNEARTPYKYTEFPEKSGWWNVPILIERDILRRNSNLIKSVIDIIFVWPLDGTHVFFINS